MINVFSESFTPIKKKAILIQLVLVNGSCSWKVLLWQGQGVFSSTLYVLFMSLSQSY